MNKKFEKDYQALSEIVINPSSYSFVYIYSADNAFSITVYGVRGVGVKDIVHTVSSSSAYGIGLSLEKLSDGNILVRDLLHGDDSHNRLQSDALIITNQYRQLIFAPNAEVTVKYYDKN